MLEKKKKNFFNLILKKEEEKKARRNWFLKHAINTKRFRFYIYTGV